jgi:aspartyl protease family protein
MAAVILAAPPASAAEVNVIGLFPGKAVVVINGTAPRTLSVGQKTPEGVTLLAADSKAATFDV